MITLFINSISLTLKNSRVFISKKSNNSLFSHKPSFSSNNSSKFKPILVSIEGNIGAGKTTLLKTLKKNNPHWNFIDEPLDIWTDIKNNKGESILEVFYRDRKRWSYTFQNCALLTRFQNIESTINSVRQSNNEGKQIFLTERCLETDYYVFTQLLKHEGSIDDIEMHLYERLLNQLKSTATPLSAIVHVNTIPHECSNRIKKRSRAGEEGISLEYLESLNHQQTKWVNTTELPIFSTDLSDIKRVEEFINGLLN